MAPLAAERQNVSWAADVLDLDATIEPGRTAAGLSIGDPIAPVAALTGCARASLRNGMERFDFAAVSVWARQGAIEQIGVRGAYTGSVVGTQIGVGSTIKAVQDALGDVIEDYDDKVLIVWGVHGFCFDTACWRGSPRSSTVRDNLDARIVELFVFSDPAS